MTRDFASKAKKRKNATRFDDSRKDNTNLVNMILGVVLGIAVALGGVYYYQLEPAAEPEAPVKKKKEAPSAKNKYKAVPAEEVEQPDFNYHDSLKKKEVEVEAEDKSLPEVNTTPGNFVLQCASFRQYSMAESLRAKIAMNGFEATVRKTTTKSDGDWYRVSMGPYKSKRNANSDRNQLERNGINGCRIF